LCQKIFPAFQGLATIHILQTDRRTDKRTDIRHIAL